MRPAAGYSRTFHYHIDVVTTVVRVERAELIHELRAKCEQLRFEIADGTLLHKSKATPVR